MKHVQAPSSASRRLARGRPVNPAGLAEGSRRSFRAQGKRPPENGFWVHAPRRGARQDLDMRPPWHPCRGAGPLLRRSRWSFTGQGETTTGKPRRRPTHPGGVPEHQDLTSAISRGMVWHPSGMRRHRPRRTGGRSPLPPERHTGYRLPTLPGWGTVWVVWTDANIGPPKCMPNKLWVMTSREALGYCHLSLREGPLVAAHLDSP